MTVPVIPAEYEQTPSMEIVRVDGSVIYFFQKLDDEHQFLPVMSDEILDWTKIFQAHMESPYYPKK